MVAGSLGRQAGNSPRAGQARRDRGDRQDGTKRIARSRRVGGLSAGLFWSWPKLEALTETGGDCR